MPTLHPLRELAGLFLRLGLTAFGGPAAHIALIDEECVRRRGWLTREQFLDVLGASNLIPGPTSTELTMHVGYRRAGWAGLVVAGVAFILPAALIVGLLAALYVRAGALPAFDGVLRAVKPVALVVVLQALTGLAKGAMTSWRTLATAVAAVLGVAAGLSEVVVLLGAGLVQILPARRSTMGLLLGALLAPVALAAAAATVPADTFAGQAGALALFGYFVKAGSVIFGSGYVLFSVFRTDLVEGLRWITEAQLLDAIAVGQVTPGPVFTSATFIGYLLHGAGGAALATVGIFLPAFAASALSVRMLHHARESASAQRFLQGVNAAAVALIAVTCLSLGRAGVTDGITAGLAMLAAVGIGVFRWNSAWLLGGAALAGGLLQAI